MPPDLIDSDSRPDQEATGALVRAELQRHWGQVLSVLVSQIGDLQRADTALQEAAATAVQQWPSEGLPAAPRVWLLRLARRNAVDQYRRELRHQQKQEQIMRLSDSVAARAEVSDATVADMRLQLMLSCTHPALDERTRIGLLLYCVCGLNIEQVAHAIQSSELSLAQQLQRAKKQLRSLSGAFLTPPADHWAARRDCLLSAIQGIYRLGYIFEPKDAGVSAVGDLCGHGMALSNLMLDYRPDDTEVISLAALLRLMHACEPARFGVDGELLPPESQDRQMWDAVQISRGCALLSEALERGGGGPQQIQACIVSELIGPKSQALGVDWSQILELYQRLYGITPLASVALSAASALSRAQGPRAGLQALDQLAAAKHFRASLSYHSERAEVLVGLARMGEARESLKRALNSPQITVARRRALERRLLEWGGA